MPTIERRSSRDYLAAMPGAGTLARWTGAISAIAALMVPLAALPARADPIADFYRRRPVDLIVGYGPGGGYDIYARLLARHIGWFIPGHPRVSVLNMPGSGSLRAVDYLYRGAPKDGGTIALFSRNMALVGLFGGSNVGFDPRKFTWLGSSSSFQNDANLLVLRRDAPVKSIAEAVRGDLPPLVLGGIAEGGGAGDVPIILRDTIGLHLKQVVGYPDSAAAFDAVERAEVMGRTVNLSMLRSMKPEWLRADGNYRVLVQFARATRHPDFPDVPTARELAKNDEMRALIELAELPYALSRPFAAPPGVPLPRAHALERAFLAAHRDPQYLAEAARLALDVSPVGGEEILRALDRIASAPPQLQEYVRKLLAETKGGG
jgi:tripartite-type tricarboxylate transporter receptor subunit TctC